MTKMPYKVHLGCAVADEGYDRIYYMGGLNTQLNAYQYTPSTDTWECQNDCTITWGTYDCGEQYACVYIIGAP